MPISQVWLMGFLLMDNKLFIIKILYVVEYYEEIPIY